MLACKHATNASPLIFLAKIDQLSLLDEYRVLIPTQVVQEIEAGKKKPGWLQMGHYLKRENVTVERVEVMESLPATLGIGERSAISLAVEERVSIVLLDERKARRIARFFGLTPRGVLWVLREAQKNGVLSKNEVEKHVLDLLQRGFRISEDLLVTFLKRLKV